MSAGPQLVVQMSSDEAKLYQGMQKLIEQQKRFEDGVGKVGKRAKQTEGELSSLANSMGSQVTGIVSGWVGVQGAISGATAVLRTYQELQEKAKKTTEELADARRELNQIASSPEQLVEFNRRSDTLAARYGVSRESVRRLQANASNFGFTDDMGFLEKAVQAEGANVASAAVIGSTGGKVSSLFNGKITPAQAVNAAFVAGQKSELTFEQMAPVLPAAIASAGPLGARPEEAIGAMSVLTSKFKSGEVASERLARLSSELGKDDKLSAMVKERGLIATMEHIGGSKSLRDQVGGESMEAKQGLNAFLENIKAIKASAKEVKTAIDETGGPNDALRRQIGIALEADKRMGGAAAARARSVGAGNVESQATEEAYGSDAFRRQRAASLLKTSQVRRGAGAVEQSLSDFQQSLMDYLPFFYNTDYREQYAASQIAANKAFQDAGGGIAGQLAAQKAASEMMTASMEKVAQALERATNEFSRSSAEMTRANAANAQRVQRQAPLAPER